MITSIISMIDSIMKIWSEFIVYALYNPYIDNEKDYMKNIISHRKRTAANRYIAITIVKKFIHT